MKNSSLFEARNGGLCENYATEGLTGNFFPKCCVHMTCVRAERLLIVEGLLNTNFLIFNLLSSNQKIRFCATNSISVLIHHTYFAISSALKVSWWNQWNCQSRRKV